MALYLGPHYNYHLPGKSYFGYPLAHEWVIERRFLDEVKPAAAEEKKPEETPKAEEKKEEAPKAEEKKEEAPKAEEKKEEAPKAEEKKEEAPKAEEKKEEAPKAEEKKEEAPKPLETIVSSYVLPASYPFVLPAPAALPTALPARAVLPSPTLDTGLFGFPHALGYTTLEIFNEF